ncbi:uncharacterized protein [Centroberyx affinis]|uniref:uncharacterized protein n=1 Tax=Centroberyx affinis TaxID=166261 RepID=UPI003A5C11BB
MADFRRTRLSLFLLLLFQTVGADTELTSLDRGVGDEVVLPCTAVSSGSQGCSSVTWTYGRTDAHRIEMVTGGKFKSLSQQTRLSLRSDCSLTIQDIRAEDAGFYVCQRWLSSGSQSENWFYLSLLSVTQQTSDGQLQLKCSLIYFDTKCERKTLSWLDETETKIEDDRVARSGRCFTMLTLLEEEKKKRFRCQLTANKKVQRSVDFTFSQNRMIAKGRASSTDGATAEPPTGSSSQNYIMAAAAAAGAAVMILAAVFLIRRRKTSRDARTPAGNAAPSPVGDADATANLPSPDHEDPDDGVSYASIIHFSKNRSTPNGRVQGPDPNTNPNPNPNPNPFTNLNQVLLVS